MALGTSAYVRATFRVDVLAAERADVAPGSLLVSTHRAETDAPLLIYALYWHAGIRGDRSKRVWFAARQDLYEPGFFAGFPERMPPWARRALAPVAIGRFLPLVRVHPIRSAQAMPLAAARRRSRRPDLDALSPRELWRFVGAEELPDPQLWAHWRAEATEDLRRLVTLLRAGEPLVLFPEGRPSPDGEIGPLRRGVGLLVRRGRPETIRPIGLAYDPFVRGRTRAYVSFGEPLAPPERDVEDAVLAALKLATPLTCGAAVAYALLHGGDPERAVERAVGEAREEGRNVERALLSAEARRARLAECLAHVRRGDPRVGRLAREYESARATSPAP